MLAVLLCRQSCLYKYSFRRALYASILRSALVLHTVTLLVLAVILLTLSLTAQFIDSTWFDSTLVHLQPEALSAYYAALVSPASWLGVDAAYVMASLLVIGVTGFLTLGMFGPMLWPGRGQQDTILVVVIFIGLLRTFVVIYKKVKSWSGRLLQKAESVIVHVGASPPMPRERPPTTLPAGQAEQALPHGSAPQSQEAVPQQVLEGQQPDGPQAHESVPEPACAHRDDGDGAQAVPVGPVGVELAAAESALRRRLGVPTGTALEDRW